jgi:hypothetical protein
MIGSLTAIRLLSDPTERPLLATILYILGPSLIGFVGYAFLRRGTRRYLSHEPALERMLEARARQARETQRQANLSALEDVPWHMRWAQLTAPVLGLTGYLIWSFAGVRYLSMSELPVPVTTKDWLLVLPYILLFPLLLSRDAIQRRLLRRGTGARGGK